MKSDIQTIVNKMAVEQAVILNKLANIEKRVDSIDEKLDKEYATKEWCEARYGEPTKQFKAIISLILSAVVIAVVGLVIRK